MHTKNTNKKHIFSNISLPFLLITHHTCKKITDTKKEQYQTINKKIIFTWPCFPSNSLPQEIEEGAAPILCFSVVC